MYLSYKIGQLFILIFEISFYICADKLTAPINLVLNEQHFTALVSHDSDYQFKSSSAPENQYEKFVLEFD
jgi:hypothetical protein